MGTQLSMLDQIEESNHWHKSTSASELERQKEQKKGKSQKSVVFELMKDNLPRTSMEVQRCLRFNLNSIRRCLSNLERDGYLKKLESGVVESEGKFNRYYKKV